MGNEANIETFVGKPVRDYAYGQRTLDPVGVVYRLRIPWEVQERGFMDPEATETSGAGGLFGTITRLLGAKPKPHSRNAPPAPFVQLLDDFLQDPASAKVSALVIGQWGASTDSADLVVNALAERAGHLPNLRALFLGDIAGAESEISWIAQTDLAPLWKAFPALEHLHVRGSNHLSLGRVVLPHLKTLILVSGGLPARVVHEVCEAQTPALEHLELWLGAEDYGGDSALNDVRPLLDGALFPRLTYLGLRNCEYVDAIAQNLGMAPFLARLRVLDLSLGTLSDAGGEALLQAVSLRHLERLDLHYHYLSAAMMARLQALGSFIDVSEPQEADEEDDEVHRYVAVSE
jgi:hypothetical protein